MRGIFLPSNSYYFAYLIFDSSLQSFHMGLFDFITKQQPIYTDDAVPFRWVVGSAHILTINHFNSEGESFCEYHFFVDETMLGSYVYPCNERNRRGGSYGLFANGLASFDSFKVLSKGDW
jgi:hypothetical protein